MPDNFCELGGSNPETRRKEEVQEAFGESLELLSMFAPCNELNDFVGRKIAAFTRWGIVAVPKNRGAHFPAPSTAAVVGEATKQATEDASDTLNRLENRLQRQLREQVPIEPITSGILASNAAAYYGLMESVRTPDGKLGTVIAVVGMTAAKGAVVSYRLSEVAQPTSTFEGLIQRQGEIIERFLALNK